MIFYQVLFRVNIKNINVTYAIKKAWYSLKQSGAMATNTTIDAWKFNGSGVATPLSSNNGNNNGNGSTGVQGTFYITPGGKSYHNSRNCTALKRSVTVLAVSYSEVINRGKTDPCNLCVKK